jgi:hypothetical protein
METWSQLSDYSQYEVTTLGKIRNKKTKYVLKQREKNGYLSVTLVKDKIKNNCLVHRLVAISFIPNFDKEKNTVNHIDHNKLNNNINNLEWVTQKENIHHAIENNLINNRTCKIIQYDMNNNQIQTFDSLKQITELFGFDRSSIIRVCKNRAKTAYGYKWTYAEEQEIINSFDGNSLTNYSNYLINTDGNVYSKKYKKILKPIQNQNGHTYVSLIHDITGKKSNFYIHRLVAELYLENENNLNMVIHINGEKSDNRLQNLKWVSYINQYSAS